MAFTFIPVVFFTNATLLVIVWLAIAVIYKMVRKKRPSVVNKVGSYGGRLYFTGFLTLAASPFLINLGAENDGLTLILPFFLYVAGHIFAYQSISWVSSPQICLIIDKIRKDQDRKK